MNVWKIVCATLVIFIAGILTGALLVRIGERGPKPWLRPPRETINRPQGVGNGPSNPVLLNQSNQPGNNPSNPGPGPLGRDFAAALERQLRLTPEQREQVQKLLGEGQERIRALRQKLDPQVRQEMQQTHEQIQALLTPAQREQFQRVMKQRLLRRNDGPGQPERRNREPREPRGAPELRESPNQMPPSDDARNAEPQRP